MIKVGIFGNIGSGKTTSGNLLQEKTGMKFIEEPYQNNIWLKKMFEVDLSKDCCKDQFEYGTKWSDYWKDYCSVCGNPLSLKAAKYTYSGITQIEFLYERLNLYMKYYEQQGDFIIERSIRDDAYCFAQKLFNDKEMSQEWYDTYLNQFSIISKALELANIHKPEIAIFLLPSVDVLLNNIKNRGREWESFYLTPEGNNYIKSLAFYYEQMAVNWTGTKIILTDFPYDIDCIVDFIKKGR
jgi:deoxyadenosine/deoxycytidine kinase